MRTLTSSAQVAVKRDTTTMSKFTIPEEIQRAANKRARAFKDSVSKKQPSRIERGQIWSTRGDFVLPDGQRFVTREPKLVVVLNTGSGRSVIGAPLSIQVWQASEYDLIVSGDNNPLSFDFLVEVWNETPVLNEQLRVCLTRLPEHVSGWLDELYTAYLLDEEIPSRVLDYVGPPLMGQEDFRREFQTSELAAVEYLSRASAAMLDMVELVKRPNITPSRLRIELGLPTLRKLSDFLKASSSQLAYAADSGLDESHAWMITVKEYPDTIFELLIDKGRLIYLLPHSVDKYLQNKRVTVTLQTNELDVVTDLVALEPDREIPLGEVPGFDVEHIKGLYLEVVEE